MIPKMSEVLLSRDESIQQKIEFVLAANPLSATVGTFLDYPRSG